MRPIECVGCIHGATDERNEWPCGVCKRRTLSDVNLDYYETLETKWKETDNVNHPQHYKLEGLDIEVIDLIRSATGTHYKGYLLGNLIKYVMRYQKKNGVEDLKKAKVYLNWLIEVSE